MDRNACDGGKKIQCFSEDNVHLFEILTDCGVNKTEQELEHLQPIFKELSSSKIIDKVKKEKIMEILDKYKGSFCKNKDDLGFCPLVKHEIIVKEDESPKQTYHRLPIGLEERVEAEIENLLKKGIIRESNSPWNSPIVVVKKPNNDLRICLNYKKLNAVTVRPTYYIPDAGQIFDSLTGAKFFSTLDLSNAYYQCEIKEEHKKYTAFSTRKGKYEFQKMPFGLCGAPFSFQQLMSLVLKEENWKSCVIYLDDVLIYSSTFEQHVKHVETILRKIEGAGLKLSPSKCHFFSSEVKFLGHVVNSQGLQTDPAKIEKIKNWSKPETVAELRSFLGFCNYYRKFISNYALLSAELENALSNLDKKKSEKNIKLTWSDEMSVSYEKMKDKLCNPPILAFPRQDCEYILDTDASYYGIGAVLSQMQDNEEKVIAYASRKLTKYERSYCITRKELLSAYYFITYFKQYLLGKKFKIRTDHKALTWLMGWKQPKTAQYCHWISELEIYEFEIEHRKGKDHVNADFLSRIEDCGQCEIKHADPKKSRNVKIEYFPRANLIKHTENLTVGKKMKILKEFHDDIGHIGVVKMNELLLRNYCWDNIRNDIREYVSKCFSCAQRKVSGKKGGPDIPITAFKPFERVMIDISGPLVASKNGYRYILGIVDVFSRFVMLIPVRSVTSKAIIDILTSRWIPLFGVPEILVSDGAYNLNSAMINDLFDEFGIHKVTSSPYHPQSNGIIERDFRTIKDMIFATVDSYGGDWVSALPMVEIGLRSAQHRTTKASPYEVIFGRKPKLPQFVAENLHFDNLSPKEYIDNLENRRRKLRETIQRSNEEKNMIEVKNLFKVGERVMMKSLPIKKMGVDKARFEGPGVVVSIIDPKSYLVSVNGKIYRRHENSLKSYLEDN